MAEPVAGRPVSWGFAWSAAIGAAVVTFLLTVVMPPTGFLVGIAGLVALCVGLARRRTSLLTAVSAGVVAAVVCYLGIWIAGSIVDPGAPDNGSGSSAGKPSEISVHPHHDASRYAQLVHHVLPLEECTVEVATRSLTIERYDGSTADAATAATRS